MSRLARAAAQAATAALIVSASPHVASAGSPYDGWRGQSAAPSYAGGPYNRRPLDGSYRAAPAPIWSGLYVGGNFGYDWGGTTPNGISTDRIKGSGALGGLHAGYNFQFDRFVTGFEVDLSFGNESGSAVYANGVSAASELNWLSSARLRAGYSFDSLMLYATGGVAFADLNIRTAAGGVTSNTSEVMTGWVLGAGVETKLTQNISARLEALHYRFGDERFGTSAGVLSVDKDITTVRAGLSLHLN